MEKELVIVLDFGGQYNQLVARRVRECNVYCEIYSYKTDINKIKEMNPKGIILTGGPNSCYEEGAPTYSKELFEKTQSVDFVDVQIGISPSITRNIFSVIEATFNEMIELALDTAIEL